MRTKPRVVVTQRVHPEVTALLDEYCEVLANPSRGTLPREGVLQLAREADDQPAGGRADQGIARRKSSAFLLPFL